MAVLGEQTPRGYEGWPSTLPSVFETRPWDWTERKSLTRPEREIARHLTSWLESRQWQHTNTYGSHAIAIGPNTPDFPPDRRLAFVFTHQNPPTERSLVVKSRLAHPLKLLNISAVEQNLLVLDHAHYPDSSFPGVRAIELHPKKIGPYPHITEDDTLNALTGPTIPDIETVEAIRALPTQEVITQTTFMAVPLQDEIHFREDQKRVMFVVGLANILPLLRKKIEELKGSPYLKQKEAFIETVRLQIEGLQHELTAQRAGYAHHDGLRQNTIAVYTQMLNSPSESQPTPHS